MVGVGPSSSFPSGTANPEWARDGDDILGKRCHYRFLLLLLLISPYLSSLSTEKKHV